MLLRRSALRRMGAIATVASLFAIGLPVSDPAPATARTEITVTTAEDELNADGDCSLREAVAAANTNLPVDACPAGTPGHDEVILQPVVYILSIPGRDEDAAMTGDLDITEALTIRTGGEVTDQWAVIDANRIDRVFDVMPQARWYFYFLEIAGGDAADGEGGGVRVRDGLCDADGEPMTGSIHASTIRDNVAARGGGLHIGSCRHPWLRWLSIVGNRAVAEGGGVSSTGDSNFGLDVSTVSSNTAAIGGGLWIDLPRGSIHLGHVTVAANAAPEAAGLWTANWTTLEATVIGDSVGPNCGGPGQPSNGLSDDETCGGSSVPDLGLLALTRVGHHHVHPPGPDSIVVDYAGEPFPDGSWCQSESASDQIGTPWPIDGNGDGLAYCDAGAVEAAEGTAQPPARPRPPAPPAPEAALPDTAQPSPGDGRSLWGALMGTFLIGAALVRLKPIRRLRPSRLRYT